MTTIGRSEIPRLAELLVEVGQRLGSTVTREGRPMAGGEAAWFAAQEFEPGPRAHTTDPGGGNRWERDEATDEVFPVATDTTGDTAVRRDPTALAFVRYRALLGQLEDLGHEVRDLLGQLLRPQPNTRVEACSTCGTPRPVISKRRQDVEANDVVKAGWCGSCYRDDKYLQPIQTRPSGEPYYRTYCRWCGGFKADWGIEPPRPLLALFHTYGRVSVAQVEAHVPKKVLAARRQRKAG